MSSVTWHRRQARYASQQPQRGPEQLVSCQRMGRSAWLSLGFIRYLLELLDQALVTILLTKSPSFQTRSPEASIQMKTTMTTQLREHMVIIMNTRIIITRIPIMHINTKSKNDQNHLTNNQANILWRGPQADPAAAVSLTVSGGLWAREGSQRSLSLSSQGLCSCILHTQALKGRCIIISGPVDVLYNIATWTLRGIPMRLSRKIAESSQAKMRMKKTRLRDH